MTNSSDSYELFISPLLSVLAWVGVVLVLLGIAWILNKGDAKAKPNVKTRMWKRLEYSHAELLPFLDYQEKKEMIDLLNTTVANAELFKDMSLEEKECMFKSKPQRNCSKRVEFKL